MSIELISGDFLDELPKIDQKFDLIFSDLPYGTTNCKWDTPIDLVRMWPLLWSVLKPNGAIVLFAQTPFDKVLGCSQIEHLKYEWIWEKTQATGHLNAKKMPMKSHENILVFYKKLPTYNPQKTTGHKPMNSYTKYVSTQNNTQIYGRVNKEISGGGETDRYPRSVVLYPSDKQRIHLHDTQKPLSLNEYIINTYTNVGDMVLDICMGSGTSGLACRNLDRKYVGIEKDPEIFKISKNRIFS
jgi:site-specific DNA-methyltransferase (adenine-specific)